MADAKEIYELPDLYDIVMGPLAQEGQELAFYRAQSQASDGPVLELACGSGRLTIPLAKDGIDISGLDMSDAMIQRARAKADKHGVTIPWVVADMRVFELERRFGLIFIPLNSLLHLHSRAEYEDLLACIRKHLLPDGHFVLSVYNPSVEILARAPNTRHPFMPPSFDPETGQEIRTEESTNYDAATQTSGTTIYYRVDGVPDEVATPLNLRCLFPQELEALLHYNGFEMIERHGDYEGHGFTSQSTLQVLRCRVRSDVAD